MMKKKLFSILTFLTMTASMGSLNAFACECLDHLTFINDYPYYVTSSAFGGIVVETDGTEFTMDMLDDNKIIGNIQTFDEYYCDRVWGFQLFDFSTDETAYAIELNSNISKEERIALARSLMLEFDFIKDVHDVSLLNCQQPRFFREMLITADNAEIIEKMLNDSNQYPEFADAVMEGKVEYSEIPSGYWCYFSFEEQDSMVSEGLAEPWEIHKENCRLADIINEKYGDMINVERPEVAYLELDDNKGLVTSAWDTAGDSNTDGTVDASDAADVLTIAAQNGTGAGIKATSANDVNADGNVDASDAAAVLCYAAAQGTGAEVTWLDILKK